MWKLQLRTMAFKEEVKELSRELKTGLSGLTKPRIDLIALAVISLCGNGSTNLADKAAGVPNAVLRSSNYKRLQRFIKQVDWHG